MSRKTRTRQTRIHAALQSGYCAICHLPYNSLDDHIQSKKHLKLIGEDANYISINGFIDQNSLEPFLNLNGIESIDINGRQIEKEFSSRRETRNTRNRAMSVDRIGPSPIDSPIHHHLRSRKQINYAMSPSLDEDSLNEKPDIIFKPRVKETKEKRSSCRNVSMKILDTPVNENIEVWDSGRPKRRSCIRSKRTSADERLVVDNKTYYKVEVMSNKLRSSSGHSKEQHEVKHNTDSQGVEKTDKGLIVKFKKMRHSELTLLNNEAENFLFPKKDDSSSSSEEGEEDDDIDADGANTTVSSGECHQDSFLPSSDTEEYKPRETFKVEDEGSMDSTTSSGKRKKKRRTHAEAFIMDNQKYYKFETPGSRLRYHGSFFSELGLKSPKHNGEVIAKEETLKIVEPEEEKIKTFNLNNSQFSFETVPSGEIWYSTFRRQDCGEESYMYLPDDGCGDPVILPYQVSSIPPLDPKLCISQYVQLKKLIQEHQSASGSRTSCSTPEPSENNYPSFLDNEPMDEDSKSSERSNSIEFCSENSNSEDAKSTEIRKYIRKGKLSLGKNPRKSPRQHASTLAILSSLIQQRKKKSKNGEPSSTSTTIHKVNTLPPIPEEVPMRSLRIDYDEILRSIHQDWDAESLVEDIHFESEESVEFSRNQGILDLLKKYDEMKLRDDFKSTRRFINGTPGRKPGRRKMNKTGWPNRKKGLVRKEQNLKEESSSIGSLNDSEEEPNTTDSIKDVNKLDNKEIVNGNCDLNRVQVENIKNLKTIDKVQLNNVKKSVALLQPFVKVRKLETESVFRKDESVVLSTKRTNKRRMPASPKSPRMLRKPRGKWYKER
ncbi:hypothetical protein HHI36_007498 [Cryptolaemus montrouzieri]|uniref:DBF4-type domain-containing protein n=1 Tax=Cryptolaemus montrouzieri TaxID=559131 RepID=A0ABD2MPT6_9CUCU